MKKTILMVLLAALAAAPAAAQEWYGALTYTVAIPTDNLSDYISRTSWRGVTLEGRRVMGNNKSIGFMAGWQVFDEKATSTIELGEAGGATGGAVTGTQFRFVNAFPLMLNGHYYFGQRRGPRVFVGLNAGTYIIEQRFEIGTTALQDTNWHLGVAPELGIAFDLSYSAKGVFTARYNYAASAGDFDSRSWVSFHAGLVWWD